jgi:hypothetical protein
MREIAIKIDCGEKKCDKCMFAFSTKTSSPFCCAFNDFKWGDKGLTTTGYRNYLRLPECLEAEKRVINAP